MPSRKLMSPRRGQMAETLANGSQRRDGDIDALLNTVAAGGTAAAISSGLLATPPVTFTPPNMYTLSSPPARVTDKVQSVQSTPTKLRGNAPSFYPGGSLRSGEAFELESTLCGSDSDWSGCTLADIEGGDPTSNYVVHEDCVQNLLACRKADAQRKAQAAQNKMSPKLTGEALEAAIATKIKEAGIDLGYIQAVFKYLWGDGPAPPQFVVEQQAMAEKGSIAQQEGVSNELIEPALDEDAEYQAWSEYLYADGPAPRNIEAEKQAARDKEGVAQQERELQELIERTLAEEKEHKTKKEKARVILTNIAAGADLVDVCDLFCGYFIKYDGLRFIGERHPKKGTQAAEVDMQTRDIAKRACCYLANEHIFGLPIKIQLAVDDESRPNAIEMN